MRIYGQRLGKHIHEPFAPIVEGINLKLPAVADNLKGRIQEGNIPPTVPSRIFVSAGKNGAFMPIDACEGDIQCRFINQLFNGPNNRYISAGYIRIIHGITPLLSSLAYLSLPIAYYCYQRGLVTIKPLLAEAGRFPLRLKVGYFPRKSPLPPFTKGGEALKPPLQKGEARKSPLQKGGGQKVPLF
jgi:hypothetical protein